MKRHGLIWSTILVRAFSECGEPQANLDFAHLSNVTVHVSSEILIKPGNILNAVDLHGVCTLRHGRIVSSSVVTLYTIKFNIKQSYVLPTQCVYVFVWISEQTAIISLCSNNWLVVVTDRECVYCAVRTGSSYRIRVSFHFKWLLIFYMTRVMSVLTLTANSSCSLQWLKQKINVELKYRNNWSASRTFKTKAYILN